MRHSTVFYASFFAESPTLCTTLILSVVCWILGISVGKPTLTQCVSRSLSNHSTKQASLKEVKSKVSEYHYWLQYVFGNSILSAIGLLLVALMRGQNSLRKI